MSDMTESSGSSPSIRTPLPESLRACPLVPVLRASGPQDYDPVNKLLSEEAAATAYRDIIPLADVVFAGEDEAAIALTVEPVQAEKEYGSAGRRGLLPDW